MDIATFSKMTAGLFAVVDPIGTVPLFIAITQGMKAVDKKHAIRLASLTALGVMLTTVFAGEAILHFFGIRIAAFQVVGGMLILAMAFSMLNAEPGRTRRTPEEEEEAIHKPDIAIVPLAIPLIAGPGSISTIIMYSQNAHTPLDTAALAGACTLTVAATFLTLSLAGPVAKMLGKTGVNIVTRIMGLILAAVAIEFFASGLTELFPGLAGQ